MEDATTSKLLVWVREPADIVGMSTSVADRLAAAGTPSSSCLLVRPGMGGAWPDGDGEDAAALLTEGMSA